ncbi:hypothetical protein G6730_08995 [Polynucleobacter paneuropaeus]|nr:hypothetical protein [Polynucleobacter paneuropaeus]
MMVVDAQAQSAFAGFYGQASTGYENNQIGSMSGSNSSGFSLSGNGQNFGGAPLVFGIGNYWQATDKWSIGLGADYSALTQSSPSNLYANETIAPGKTISHCCSSIQLSSRFNFFLSPAYVIDKEKLVYIKAGYSQVSTSFKSAETASVSSTQGGYLIGLGYKQIITSGLYGFVEGNYMGYKAPSYTFKAADDESVTNNFSSLNTYQLLIGLGYAF